MQVKQNNNMHYGVLSEIIIMTSYQTVLLLNVNV